MTEKTYKTVNIDTLKPGDKFIGRAFNNPPVCEVVEHSSWCVKTRVVGETHIYNTMKGINVRVPEEEPSTNRVNRLNVELSLQDIRAALSVLEQILDEDIDTALGYTHELGILTGKMFRINERLNYEEYSRGEI